MKTIGQELYAILKTELNEFTTKSDSTIVINYEIVEQMIIQLNDCLPYFDSKTFSHVEKMEVFSQLKEFADDVTNEKLDWYDFWKFILRLRKLFSEKYGPVFS